MEYIRLTNSGWAAARNEGGSMVEGASCRVLSLFATQSIARSTARDFLAAAYKAGILKATSDPLWAAEMKLQNLLNWHYIAEC